MAWRVVDWASRYENNRSRELKHLTWFPCPNSFDQDPWAAMVEAGPDVVAAWIALLISASRSPVRGELLKPDGRPHDACSLSRSSRIPAESFAKCIDIAIREAVLECGNVAGGCDDPAVRCGNVAGGCGNSGVELELEGNRTEENRTEENTQNNCAREGKPLRSQIQCVTPVTLDRDKSHAPGVADASNTLAPEQRWLPHYTQHILSAMPKRCQTNHREFWPAVANALDRIQGGADPTPVTGGTQQECIAWLISRAKEYAASDEGKTQYATRAVMWMNKAKYLDPPEAWKRESTNGTHYAPVPRRTMADIHREREKGEYPED